jgi:hypothetical protein
LLFVKYASNIYNNVPAPQHNVRRVSVGWIWRKITSTMHHQEQDARSLALHTAAVDLMRVMKTPTAKPKL